MTEQQPTSPRPAEQPAADEPGRVRVETDGAVVTLTLDDPARLNAVSTQMLDDLADALGRLDEGVRVVVLTGEGRGFCSGAALGSADTTTLAAGARAVRALRDCPATTVSLVNGVAAGIGVSLALACDYSLAHEKAAFMLAFTKIGLMPDGGATALVAASVGRARALRLALTAEKLPATTAGEWGLVSEVADDAAFADRGRELVTLFATSAPLGLRETASAINAAALDGLDAALQREVDGQTRLLGSADFAEGKAAFLGKREPRYTGR